MALSLEKKQELVGLQLAKKNIPEGLIMRVKSATDVSGSMQGLFNSGVMQELFNRLIPVAMRFDDNGELESFAYGSKAEALEPIVADDFDTYVNDKFLPSISSKVLWGGTDFIPALKLILEDITGVEVVEKPVKRFFGLFQGTEKVETPKSLFPPTYVMFQTDGDTHDETGAEAMIKKFADKKTYIQLIGVGRGSNFGWLKKMADKYDYVGFVTFPDLANTSDQKMYEALLGDELCTWIKAQ